MGIAIEVFMFYFLIVDLYKWGIFIVATSDQSKYNYEELFSKRKRYLKIALFVTLLSITIMYFTIALGLLITADNPDLNVGNWWKVKLKDTIGAFFLIILVTYVSTLTLLIVRLK